MATYAYRGHARVIEAIEGRLSEAGFRREGEIEIADFVVTYCTSMTELEELYFGDDGLAQLLAPGCVAIDLSASTPNLANEISGVCAVSDIAMVAAPLVAKNKIAADAFERVNLATFVGGDGDAVERAMPLVEAVFGDVTTVPDAGSAQLARSANTIQTTAEMVASVEVLSLHQACLDSVSSLDVKGMTPDATSPEAFFVMEAVKEERYEGSYTVEMLLADLSAAMMTADDYDMILPQTEAAFHLFELLAVVGGADLSPAALALVFAGEREGEDAHGLNWRRAEQLYGDGHAHAHDDPDAIDPDELDFDGYDDDDEFGSGFGYSVN